MATTFEMSFCMAGWAQWNQVVQLSVLAVAVLMVDHQNLWMLLVSAFIAFALAPFPSILLVTPRSLCFQTLLFPAQNPASVRAVFTSGGGNQTFGERKGIAASRAFLGFTLGSNSAFSTAKWLLVAMGFQGHKFSSTILTGVGDGWLSTVNSSAGVGATKHPIPPAEFYIEGLSAYTAESFN